MHSYAERRRSIDGRVYYSPVFLCVAFAANSSELMSLVMDVLLPVLQFRQRENKWLVRMKTIYIKQLIIRRGANIRRGGQGGGMRLESLAYQCTLYISVTPHSPKH